MALSLSLPPIDDHSPNPPETKPARVREWLDEMLQRDDAAEAARLIGDSLAATNRAHMSHARRLELAEMYQNTANALWPHLERAFSRGSHPLIGTSLQAAKSALQLAHELSTAYKRLLAHEADRRLVLVGRGMLLALVHRCLQCSARILVTSYLSYSPVPARTWLDAHAIYAFTRNRRLHQQPIAANLPDATAERIYLQSVLLSLANPYGFMPGQVNIVLKYLAEYCHWAKLTHVAPVHRQAKAVAIIPIGSDFPPYSANKGGSTEGGDKLFLLTFDLAFQIQEQLRSLDAGADPPVYVSKEVESRGQFIVLLRRLLRQWAIPPARQFNRLPSRARVAICAGLPAIHHYSRNGGGPAMVEAAKPTLTVCQVMNHTPAGYALRQVDGAHASLQIGELIGLRIEGKPGTQVAMVRWFRNTLRSAGLEFGCELLAENPEAVAIRPEHSEEPFTPAVLLPEDKSDGSMSMLLATNNVYEIEQALSVQRGKHTSTAVLTKVAETGPGFELFEFVAV